MNIVREKLQGYKTYIVAAAGFITAIIGYTEGVLDEQGLGTALVAMILAMTMGAKLERAGN
ncbi:hypothetical protein HN588_10495 [Candidatus Bathyarchaeota archaeon]|jgi:hypothetical protein|nr:hypothetical protein [Candidatus Bathyarchaeota archaeon]